MNIDNRLPLKTYVMIGQQKYRISTVQLPVPQISLCGTYPYETMIFRVRHNGELDYDEVYCSRYPTAERAISGHIHLLDMAKHGNLILGEAGDRV